LLKQAPLNKIAILLFLLFSVNFSAQENKDSISIPMWKIHGRFAFGSQNTVAGNFNINSNYKKGKVNWDSKIIKGYGISHIS
jgi:hypothetical protein